MEDNDDPLVQVPWRELSADALKGVIENFVLREGTEYGWDDVPLASKVSEVAAQLATGEAIIVFDPRTESIDIRSTRG